jgi:hypothetical protein
MSTTMRRGDSSRSKSASAAAGPRRGAAQRARSAAVRTATGAGAVVPAGEGQPSPAWTFLSNHAHVLLALARDPSARLRDVATLVGITERAVQRIVADLEAEGYLTRERNGRRNEYSVHADRPLRHPIEAHRKVRALIDLVVERDDQRRR